MSQSYASQLLVCGVHCGVDAAATDAAATDLSDAETLRPALSQSAYSCFRGSSEDVEDVPGPVEASLDICDGCHASDKHVAPSVPGFCENPVL